MVKWKTEVVYNFDHLTMGVGSHKNILGSNSGNVQRSVSFEAFEFQKGVV